MSRSRRLVVVPALLSATFAAAAGAQQAQCSVDEGKPGQVARALILIESARAAQSASKPADAARHLSSAVKLLTEAPEKINNPNGRNMVLGKALSLWLQQPDVGYTAKRATLGYASDPEGTVDLVAAIDEAFGSIEKAEPGCVAHTAAWRAQKPWVTLVNGAIEHLNGGRSDSAEIYAKRSMQLYSAAPYGHMVLGNLTQTKNADEAIEHYRMAVAAATDSSFDEAKRGILLSMASLAAEVSDSATQPAAKQKYAGIATQVYEQITKEFPNSQQATAAQTGLSRLRLATGDTAGFRATYADQIANPSKYTYHELLGPAVAAARAGQHADAAKLFENVLTLNAYNRDALFNGALMYHEMKDFEKMLPLIGRLTAIDPSNDDNWRLYAHAYSGMARALRPASPAPAARSGGAAARPAAAKLDPATEARIKSYNDSTVKYFEMAEKMQHKVEFTEWSNGAEKSSLAGTVMNKSAQAKSYELTFEFLDKAGAVVDTQTVSVANVSANDRGRFSVATAKAGVVGFRYKPIS